MFNSYLLFMFYSEYFFNDYWLHYETCCTVKGGRNHSHWLLVWKLSPREETIVSFKEREKE